MFLKLCKMELKYSWRSFALMYAVLILCSFLINVSNSSNSDFMNFIQGVLILLFTASIIAIGILVVVNIVRNFARSMFGKDSYLTHTLPVTSAQLLLSKTFIALIWSFISMLVIFMSIMIFAFRIAGLPSLDEWMYLFRHLEFSLDFILITLSMLFEYTHGILQIFFVMTLVHTCYFHKHRIAYGIGIYLLLNIIQSYILQISLRLTSTMIGGPAMSLFMISDSGEVNWLSFAVSLILCCIYFLATKYLLDEKLEIE